MSIKVTQLKKSFKMFKRQAGLKNAFTSFFNRKYETFHALKGIDLNIDDGEILGVLGENGAGKTTLMKILIGLLYPTEGDVFVDDYVPSKRNKDFLRQISIVMGQKNQLWWDIPASESFLLNKQIYNLSDVEYKDSLDELVTLFDVSEKLDVQVRRLSLGERMKMEIIAALLHRPKIILLDEPTIGLDVIAQSKIRDFITYYNQEHKSTFLLTSHYMSDIEKLCKRVAVIHQGIKLYDGQFSTLIDNINPTKKMMFEFQNLPSKAILKELEEKYTFTLENNILTTHSPEKIIPEMLADLFAIEKPTSFRLEDLPVEDTMKSFFENPDEFI
jgi:ABC-2 type transport system ATP-binding protein